MLKQASTQLAFQVTRNFSTSKQNNFKVTVCGAAGGIGQPLSLLLKLNPLVTELSLYDIQGTPGVAADLSHIDTASCVTGFKGPEQLADALKGADIVTIPAGVPRKPGMTRDDLFDKNASIVRDLTEAFSKSSPKAILAIITNPVNSVLPIAVEVLKKNCTYNNKRVFGVSTLDIVRSRTFVGEKLNVDPQKICIPVIGGHSGITIIPLFSQCKPEYCGEVEKLTKRVQEAGTEVVKAKAGAGSATLAMAYSGCLFIDALLRGLNGEKDIVQCAFVESDVCDGIPFFASPVRLGKEGLEENLGVPEMNDFEKNLLTKALPDLLKNIKRGVDFVKSKKCANVVIVPAGVPRKPGMTRDDLFSMNASVVRDIANAVSQTCPKAILGIITNPVNSVVPIAAEVLKKLGTYDPKRVFGISTLDVVRSRAFVGQKLDVDPQKVSIPVIGGHSGVTIIPLLSQANPKYSGEVENLTKRIQEAGTEVVKAKAGAGSATLSMAYAGARFADAVLKGLNGEKNVVECSYVESNVTEAPFFATPILFGKNGLEENLGLPKMNDYEKQLLKAALPELLKEIKKGIDFAKS